MNIWIPLPEVFDMLGQEQHVDAAEPVPENNLRPFYRLLAVPSHRFIPVPHDNLILRDAYLEGAVPSQMFIREEEDLFALSQCPPHHPFCYRGGANGAILFPAKGLEVCRGVYIGHR